MTYDLAVAWRIYPGVSKPSKGLPFDDDKLRQAELCIRSFRRATHGLRVKLWAVMDGCPPAYEEMFRRYFDGPDLVPVQLTGAGNYGTFSRQITLLLQQTDAEYILFSEDDYLYVHDLRPMLDFLQSAEEVEFVSPLDHIDDYTLELHRFPKWVRASHGMHWRTAASTCLTFLTTKESLERYEHVFRSYERGNFDVSLWLAITKLRTFNPFARFLFDSEGKFFMLRAWLKAWRFGFRQIVAGRRGGLWVPMPSVALHLDRLHVAPGFDMPAEMIGEDARSFTPCEAQEMGG